MHRETAIVFDLGGVLIDWNPRHLYRKVFADEAVMESFLTEVCTSHWNEQQDAGRPFAEAVDELVREHPHYATEIRMFWQRWPEMIAGAIEPTVTVLTELKESGYPLYALSNWSAETFALTRPLFAFFDWFDSLIISGAEQLIKPDPRIYALLLDRIGKPAEACVFIDDSLKNISAAQALGFQTIHFQSAEQLHRELSRMEILPAAGT